MIIILKVNLRLTIIICCKIKSFIIILQLIFTQPRHFFAESGKKHSEMAYGKAREVKNWPRSNLISTILRNFAVGMAKQRLSIRFTPRNVLVTLLVYLGIQFSYIGMHFPQGFFADSPWHLPRYLLIDSLPAAVVFALNYFIVYRLVTITDITRKILVDILVSYGFMFALNLLIDTIGHGNSNIGGTIYYNTVILLMVEITYYVKFSIQENERANRAEREQLLFKYEMLKAQINPHFLFNNLSILYSLIGIDTQKSRSYVRSLSTMYRCVVSLQKYEVVSLEEEMKLLNAYTDVLHMRYGNGFVVNIRQEATLSGRYAIPYSLQLIVENVTKHNVVAEEQPMVVDLVIGEEAITVSNPIRPRLVKTTTGVGLRYLTELYSLYGRAPEVENDGKTYTIRLYYITDNKKTR